MLLEARLFLAKAMALQLLTCPLPSHLCPKFTRPRPPLTVIEYTAVRPVVWPSIAFRRETLAGVPLFSPATTRQEPPAQNPEAEALGPLAKCSLWEPKSITRCQSHYRRRFQSDLRS